ncbi:hypothetical protein [Janibacter hoylei]|nr:hypothetical protein [Janibacter hoylei]
MDLQLAPLAFHEGIVWWRALLDELPAVPDHPDWRVGLSKATDVLRSGYSEVFAACRRLDNRLWPSGGAPPKRLAVLALYPSDKVRWFVHDLPAGLLRPAELAEEEPEWLPDMISRMRPQVGTAGGRPATTAVQGLRLKPIPGRKPVHEAHILLPADTFGTPDEYRKIAWLGRKENT